MAIKFNSITFDVKDIILIVGLVAYVFRSENRIDERFNKFELKIQEIVSRADVNEVKFNARFDALNKTSFEDKKDNKANDSVCVQKFAIVHELDLRIKKKRLVKFNLV